MSHKFPSVMIDESTDARIPEALKNAGYTIFSIQEKMQGISDAEVIEYASKIKGFIITEDKDFGEELVYSKKSHNGALLLRLSDVDIAERIRLVLTTLEKHSIELLNAFSVINKNKLRIRK